MSGNFTVKLLAIVLKGFVCGWWKIWCLASGAKLSGNISCLYTSDEAEYVTLRLIFRTLSVLLSESCTCGGDCWLQRVRDWIPRYRRRHVAFRGKSGVKWFFHCLRSVYSNAFFIHGCNWLLHQECLSPRLWVCGWLSCVHYVHAGSCLASLPLGRNIPMWKHSCLCFIPCITQHCWKHGRVENSKYYPCFCWCFFFYYKKSFVARILRKEEQAWKGEPPSEKGNAGEWKKPWDLLSVAEGGWGGKCGMMYVQAHGHGSH